MKDETRKRTLVTGGAGFLGSHLCERLLKEGREVLCVDNYCTGARENILHLLAHPRFEFLRHDICFPLHVEVDEIYNFACPASPLHYQADPIQTIKTSVLGALNLLGLAKRLKCPIFQASTSEVYGDPHIHPQPEEYWGNVNPIGIRSCYDEGKRCAETLFFDYHRAHGIPIKVGRIFNTYGPRMHPNDGRVVSNLIIQALNNQPLTIYGNGTQTRSFCYADDLIEVIVRLMNSPSHIVGPINIGNPTEFTVLELANEILSLTGSSSPIEFRPLPADDPRQRRPDISQARRLLAWEPQVPLEQGLRATIDYFRELKDRQVNDTIEPPRRWRDLMQNWIKTVVLIVGCTMMQPGFSNEMNALAATEKSKPAKEMPKENLNRYYKADQFSPFVYSEWLYWQPVTADPMNWVAKTGTLEADFVTKHPVKTQSINYDFTSGYRIGAGYRIGQDAFDRPSRPWQVEVVYTRIATSQTSSSEGFFTSGTHNAVLYPALPTYTDEDIQGFPFLHGQSTQHLQYNKLDLEFAWPMFLNSNVIFRLMTGATFGWMKNQWDSHFSQRPDFSEIVENTSLEWKWWGGGLLGGGDIYLPIGYGVGFYSNAGFGLLLGRTKDHESENASEAGSKAVMTNAFRLHSFQPEVNFGAGIDYKHWFNRHVMLHLAMGWEFTWWFNLNQFGQINSNSYGSTGDSHGLIQPGEVFVNQPSGLGFHGLTSRVGLDF